jgi:hypothetical protein
VEDLPLTTVSRIRAFAALAFLAAGVALGGCTSSSPSTPSVPCAAPSGPIALVYPIPGASNVPPTFQGVIFGSQSGLTAFYQAVLTWPGASYQPLLSYVSNTLPNPAPSPTLSPSFSNPLYQFSAFSGALPAATTIGVYLNNAGSTCVPSFVGSFTTR